MKGGAPSPFDRSIGTKFGTVASEEIIRVIQKFWDTDKETCDLKDTISCQLLGINRRKVI